MPVSYGDDRAAAERILLGVAGRHTHEFTQLTDDARHQLETKYFVQVRDLELRCSGV